MTQKTPIESGPFNTLVVGVVAGFLLGFIIAMILGALGVLSLGDFPAWLQGVSGVVAAIISAYAVYLVSQTLMATRETLFATKVMLSHQREIGEAQLAPYLIISRKKVVNYQDETVISFRIKNYGTTPALGVFCQPTFEIKEVVDGQDETPVYLPVKFIGCDPKFFEAIAPNTEEEITANIHIKEYKDFSDYLISLDVLLRYRAVLSADIITQSSTIKLDFDINTEEFILR